MKTANKFFADIDYVSIINTIKGIFISDGSMALLLDFERVLDEADVYAYRNWELGELVQGPINKKYNVSCTFMWPYKLMPDPSACKRLLHLGCDIQWKKTSIEVPVEVEDYDDFQPGTRYPKMKKRKIWLVNINMPHDIMDDIRQGSVDLAGEEIDLDELDDAYSEDLEQDGIENIDQEQEQNQEEVQGQEQIQSAI